MLYHLLFERIYPYSSEWPILGVLNVFQYITFRTAMASMTALLISLLVGPALIRKLRDFQIGQNIRKEGPESHQAKAGTPTMGGVLTVVSIFFSTLLWANLGNPFVWLLLTSMCSFGLVGFVDDYLKIVKRRSLGLTARAKIGFQILVTLAVGYALMELAANGLFSTRLTIPFFKEFNPDLVWPVLGIFAPLPFLLFIGLTVIGFSNCVNLTDGLDGLAIGCVLIVSGALVALTYVTGHAVFSEYLDLQFIRPVAELTIFCGSMAGASMGFLWYNAHPAEIFMGDVGSLGLGGAIGTVAVVIRQELLLALIGGVFVIEGLSVIAQVGSYKLRGKRIFRMSPLHHHFELIGWTESKIIIRFWIVALLFALFSLSTLKLR